MTEQHGTQQQPHGKPEAEVIERIRRLLAMSKDVSSPNEAGIAARRAEAMLRKYNLEAADVIMEDLKKKESITNEDVAAGIHRGKTYSKAVPGWAQSVAVNCAELFDCHVVLTNSLAHGAALRFVGYKTDVEICKWVFSYLQDCLRRFMHTFVTQYPGRPRSVSGSYREGLSRGICDNLKAALREKTKEVEGSKTGTALVVAKRQMIEAEYGKVRYSTRKSNVADYEAHEMGVRDGRSINVNPTALHDKRTPTPKLQ